ncbi:MAG: hypothetical protein IT340_01405 [Chloroflexi bacterium]|nr:hypothetical protein [Chloroflexota bacterium]
MAPQRPLGAVSTAGPTIAGPNRRPKAPRTRLITRGVSLLAALLLAAGLLPPAPVAAESFADLAIEAYWSRADLPVAGRMTERSWLWGPEPFASTAETYKEAYLDEAARKRFGDVSQKRLVQYFDKTRMELTNPSQKNRGGITNGLLVVEMVSGQVQLGNAAFGRGFTPAPIAVAGDPAAFNPTAPTYAAFAGLATLDSVTNRAQPRVGQGITATIGPTGATGENPSLAGAATIEHFDANFGHNIPNVFWTFMNQTGPVFLVERHKTGPLANQPVVNPEGGLAGKSAEETVFNWEEAMGYPITEPYWASVRVAGQERVVLIQLFQRRVLTFTPGNAPGPEVEMGNVGRHYFEWRYTPLPAGATAVTALRTTNPAPVLQYTILAHADYGPAFDGGAGGDEPQTAAGSFFVIQLRATNISDTVQQVGRDLVVQAVTPAGLARVTVADVPTDSLNKRMLGPRPRRCPPAGCPQPVRIWTQIPPGETLTLHLVYDVPADATSLRFVPVIEDAPAMVLR